jgi:hypothetical protein
MTLIKREVCESVYPSKERFGHHKCLNVLKKRASNQKKVEAAAKKKATPKGLGSKEEVVKKDFFSKEGVKEGL